MILAPVPVTSRSRERASTTGHITVTSPILEHAYLAHPRGLELASWLSVPNEQPILRGNDEPLLCASHGGAFKPLECKKRPSRGPVNKTRYEFAMSEYRVAVSGGIEMHEI